jgi:hypothetical protein
MAKAGAERAATGMAAAALLTKAAEDKKTAKGVRQIQRAAHVTDFHKVSFFRKPFSKKP